MTIADLIKEFIDSARERIKTPVSGAFLWAFIIFNWRAIVFLIFSKASIEDKIILINYEYCHWYSVVVPIIMALIYTIGLPMLTLQIEKILKKTKKERLDYRNEYIGHQKDGKIDLAGKEWLLKNAESGNKEIQEHLDEIKSLKEQIESQKESIKQINETNKATVDELNASLKAANKKNSNRVVDTDQYKFDTLHNAIVGDTIHLDQELADEILKIGDQLTFSEFHVLRGTELSEKRFARFRMTRENESILRDLEEKGIITYKLVGTDFEALLTPKGSILYTIIKTF